jgi:drug/metabolite transporter (DMT)-like permease
MDGRLLALISVLFFGVGPVILSLGFKKSSADLAVFTTMVVGLPMLILLSPLFGGLHLAKLTPITVVFFAAGGMLGPLFGRTFLYNGIDRLGSSRAFTIKNIAPLVTGVAALLLLSELISWRRWLAIAIIVIGLGIVGKRSTAAPGPLRFSGLVLAFLSAVAFGLRPVVFKLGFREVPDPMTASVVGVAAASIGFTLYLLFTGKIRSLEFDRKSLALFAFVGVTHNLGFLIINFAFNATDVSLVYPISATAPLLTFAMSYYILKNVERLTAWDLIGTVGVVAGVIIL